MQGSYLCAKTSGNIDHSFAEAAVFQHEDLVTLLHDIDKGCLHAAGTTGGERYGQLIGGIHQLLEKMCIRDRPIADRLVFVILACWVNKVIAVLMITR